MTLLFAITMIIGFIPVRGWGPFCKNAEKGGIIYPYSFPALILLLAAYKYTAQKTFKQVDLDDIQDPSLSMFFKKSSLNLKVREKIVKLMKKQEAINKTSMTTTETVETDHLQPPVEVKLDDR